MKLALGTVQFGLTYGIANRDGQVSEDEAGRIMEVARAAGIDTLDTAILYGESEAVLGRLGTAGWRIVSKLPALPDDESDIAGWTRRQIESSLQRLRRDHLDGLLLHRPEQLLEARGEKIFAALADMRDQGLCGKIGVSSYGPAMLQTLARRYPLDLVQAPLNLLDRSLLDSGLAAQLASAGTEIHTRSAFLQGLLLMPAAARPPQFGRWQDFWQCWDDWLATTGLTPLAACLRFALAEPHVARVVIGVDRAEQLRAILAAASGTLPTLPLWPETPPDALINPALWNAA